MRGNLNHVASVDVDRAIPWVWQRFGGKVPRYVPDSQGLGVVIMPKRRSVTGKVGSPPWRCTVLHLEVKRGLSVSHTNTVCSVANRPLTSMASDDTVEAIEYVYFLSRVVEGLALRNPATPVWEGAKS